MSSNSQIGFRIDKEEKAAFENLVKRQGKKPSEILAAFVREYIQQPPDVQVNEIEQMRMKIRQHEERIAHLEQQSLGELSA